MSVLSVFLLMFWVLLMPSAPPVSDSDPVPERSGAAENTSLWVPPVDAPIVDFFRRPSNPYGAGNRGLEYGTYQGQPVRSVSGGDVLFAGSVGSAMFVVVAHSPELRSCYAFLDRILVEEGDHVGQGQLLAFADVGFHLTARVNGRYVDPLPFFGVRVGVRLVDPRSAAQLRHQSTTGPK